MKPTMLKIKNTILRRGEVSYIPQECQVHSCRRTATGFCASMYIFVCDHHTAEFCLPDHHKVESLLDGLREMVYETDRTIAGLRSELARQERLLADYKTRLVTSERTKAASDK